MIGAPQALYRFFAVDGTLLYVGISLNPGARWKQHRADKPWWSEVANVTIEHHPNRDSVMNAEREAIKAERPRYNRVHNQTPESGRRMAAMLKRMPKPPDRYKDGCPMCHEARIPTELHPDTAGWFAVYDCCDETWTRGFDAA
jgi:predicted GIY-YIG superfamily endonuclease